jgi:hypothetical protein
MTIGILFLTQTVSMHLSVTEPPKGAARSRRGFVPLAAALAAVSLASRSACASPRPRSLDDGDPGRNQSDKKCLHDAKWGREVRWIASATGVEEPTRRPQLGAARGHVAGIHLPNSHRRHLAGRRGFSFLQPQARSRRSLLPGFPCDVHRSRPSTPQERRSSARARNHHLFT